MIPRTALLRHLVQRSSFRPNNAVRRLHSTNSAKSATEGASSSSSNGPTQAQKANMSTASTAQTIPIAANWWLQPFQIPLRHYTTMNQRRPYVTQLMSTLTIWLLGDLLSQYITSSPAQPAKSDSQTGLREESPKGFSEQYDPKRTVRALIIGGIASIPSYRWFLWLGTVFNYPSLILSLSAKVVFNQLAFTPVFNCYFFGMQTALTHVMDGHFPKWQDVRERIVHTVPRSWLNSWKVWPAVTAFSFWAVPVDLRSPFAGVIAIGWQTYLSVLNQRAARQEAKDALTA